MTMLRWVWPPAAGVAAYEEARTRYYRAHARLW